MNIRSLALPQIGALYLFGYVLLEAVSYVHPFGAFGITPWNPSTGLSFVLVLLFGRRTLPLLFAAPPLAAIIVRGLWGPVWLTACEALVVGGGYAVTLRLLLIPRLRFDPSLASLRDLSILMGAAVASSAIVATAYVGLLTFAELMPSVDFRTAALRYWVGDMIGIAVVAPFGLLALTRERLVKLDWRAAAQVFAVALALGAAAASALNHQLQLFYLLFLPITWVAVSTGLEGVSVALVATQIGLFVALQFASERMIDITDLQARMFVLAVTGLVAGTLVTERRRAEEELRQNQAAVARLSRLGSMGELAAAIAHEVNQPLSAAGTYARLVRESLASETLSDPAIIEVAGKTVAQVERAAAVIRRLRALVRLGRSDMTAISLSKIVQEALDLVGPVLERGAIDIDIQLEGDLPPVLADRIQIEQVLVNLLRNSAEAITGSACVQKQILLQAKKIDSLRMEVRVCDSGPGFPEDFRGAIPPIFASNKADGLGVGLSLCRSIAEVHGGTLRVESSEGGAIVSFTLPFAEGPGND
jgi:two-component system, LuxR family, sensor kinase FixL